MGAIKKHEGWTEGETVEAGIAPSPPPGGLDPRVQKLIEIGTNTKRCEELRYEGRKAMVEIYGKITAKNACAATLTIFMREAGFPFSKTEFGAGNLARYIEKTLKWRRINVGQQEPGDVGVCRDDDPTPPGSDHVFFVTKRVDDDEMMIVNNQESFAPHARFASGFGGKTPVEYFLSLRPERSAAAASCRRPMLPTAVSRLTIRLSQWMRTPTTWFVASLRTGSRLPRDCGFVRSQGGTGVR